MNLRDFLYKYIDNDETFIIEDENKNRIGSSAKYEHKYIECEVIGIRLKTDKNLYNQIKTSDIEPLNAFKLMEAPYMAKLLKEQRYDEFMVHLKQSEVEIANKLIEVIRKINE